MDIPVDGVGRKEHIFMLLEDMSLGHGFRTKMFYLTPRHNFLCMWSVNNYQDNILIGGTGVKAHRKRFWARQKLWATVN